MLSIGSLAPAISLPDSHDSTQTLASFAGQRVFVYFYPRANTPGCTQQGCAIQTALSAGEISDVVVLGISPDKPAVLIDEAGKVVKVWPAVSPKATVPELISALAGNA